MQKSTSSAARPERLVVRVVQLAVVVGIGPQEAAAEAELLAREAHLLDRRVDRLHRQHGDAEQAVGIGLAVVGEPAVVGAAHRGGEGGIADRAGEQAEAGIEEGGVDAVEIHVGDAGVRIEAALASVLVVHRVGRDDALARADAADAAEAGAAAEDLVLQQQALLAVLVLDQLRRALAVLRVHVVVPQRERLEHMPVGIDDVVLAAHVSSITCYASVCPRA